MAAWRVGPAHAQEGATPPHWIWHPSAGEQGAVTCWFRKEFAVKEPSKLAIDATGDNRFTLFLDGREIAQGENWQQAQTVSVDVPTGTHVLAASCTNDDAPGAGGFLLRGSVLPLGQGVPIHTNRTWKTTDREPEGDAWKQPGFDDGGWAGAVDLGVLGTGPWQGIQFASGDPASGYKTPPGFTVRQVASHQVTGSVVAFTFDPDGRPVVSTEGKPVARLIDADGDGLYEARQVIVPQMSNCQGLYFDVADDGGVTLWAVGNGPTGTGIHRLGDGDGDGVFETVLHYVATDGMGEHGPHAITRGPDGSLYFNSGNFAHIKQGVDPASPVNAASNYEGELLPHYGDPRGHAVEIRAPGGEISRSDDDGKTWHRVVAGFRNEYDFAFDASGEIFSFDSDMEWDQGLPWYRPVRVNFGPPGAELGWRNGSAVWPSYYFDSLPGVLDVGRGSPTGVTFYQGWTFFPRAYDNAFLVCDWSQGRILAVRLRPEGAGFVGKAEELVSGQPLNCTDVEQGPDGAVYFTTGGRATLGGLYRLSWDEAPQPARVADPLQRALWASPPLASFARKQVLDQRAKVGAEWTPRLVRDVALNTATPDAFRIRGIDLLARTGESTPERPLERVWLALARDESAAVRARAMQLLGQQASEPARAALAQGLADPDPVARRRACEGLVRSRGPIPVAAVVPLLGDPDRWVRFAARVAIEHAPVEAIQAIRPPAEPRALMNWMLAVVRTDRPSPRAQDELLGRQVLLLESDALETPERLDLLRLVGLTYLLNTRQPSAVPASVELRRIALGQYAGEVEAGRARQPLGWELARMLAFLNEPRAIPLALAALKQAAAADDRPTQIHLAYCLRAFADTSGWTAEGRRAMWNWFETASRWDGGFSYLGYVDYMVGDFLRVLSSQERQAFLAQAAQAPFPARVLVRTLDLKAEPKLVPELATLYAGLAQAENAAAAGELQALIVEKLGNETSPEAHAALRAIAAADPARRDLVARALANHPTADDVPVLVNALGSRDPNTTRLVVQSLEKLDVVPEGPEGLRNLLILARRTGPTFHPSLDRLAARWTGHEPPNPADGFDAALAAWEMRFAERFPDAPALGAETAGTNTYTLETLMNGVLRSRLYEKSSPERGKLVLKQAKCLDCHKLGNDGAGLGPDLTTVWSRFRPHEILESVLEPSKVISDQYKSATVATTDGKVLTGMPAGGDAANLVLLLPDGTKATIARADIEEQAESKTSVMPEGLLNALSIQEIADLMALFAAQPRVEVAK